MMVPVLETERLRLRGHAHSDFAASAAMWADPEVARYISGKPSTREESWARLLRLAGHWALMGFGYWLVEEKASGRFVGEVGFGDFKRDVSPSIEGAPEQGWVLAPWSHGKGYASEAARATLDWTLPRFKSAPVCMISPHNMLSIRVAEKAGYREFARTEYKGEPALLFRLQER